MAAAVWFKRVRLTVSAAVTCHQCEGAPCMTVCPEGAIVQERDRLHVDESRCTGCLLCALVCPFGAVYPSAPSLAQHHASSLPLAREVTSTLLATMNAE